MAIRLKLHWHTTTEFFLTILGIVYDTGIILEALHTRIQSIKKGAMLSTVCLPIAVQNFFQWCAGGNPSIWIDRYCADIGQCQGSDSVNCQENADFSCLSCSMIPLVQYNIYLFVLTRLVQKKKLVK